MAYPRILTTVPAPGTAVVHAYTGKRGEVRSDGGYVNDLPVVNVWWEGRPHEDSVFLSVLRLDDQAGTAAS